MSAQRGELCWVRVSLRHGEGVVFRGTSIPLSPQEFRLFPFCLSHRPAAAHSFSPPQLTLFRQLLFHSSDRRRLPHLYPLVPPSGASTSFPGRWLGFSPRLPLLRPAEGQIVTPGLGWTLLSMAHCRDMGSASTSCGGGDSCQW